MKILKKYASIAFLLILTTMTPLNGNLEDDLIDKEGLRKWCKQYVSEEKLNTIETCLVATKFCVGVIALIYLGSGTWVKAKGSKENK